MCCTTYIVQGFKSEIEKDTLLCTNRGFWIFSMYWFNTASSAAPQIQLCRRMLRVRHWQSDALTTRLDLIHFLYMKCTVWKDFRVLREIGEWREPKPCTRPTTAPALSWIFCTPGHRYTHTVHCHQAKQGSHKRAMHSPCGQAGALFSQIRR